MSLRQNERLVAETQEQREARLQRDRERHRDQHSHLSLIDQPSVQSKMLKFHGHFATLEMPTCPTCSKRFPGLKVNSQSGECLSCNRDKRIPKLYSSENVINLPRDVASFANTLPCLPSDLDVIVVRKEGANQSHRDFRVRRS